jgi:hypothetical protein
VHANDGFYVHVNEGAALRELPAKAENALVAWADLHEVLLKGEVHVHVHVHVYSQTPMAVLLGKPL